MSERLHTTCPLTGSSDIRVLRGYERHQLVKSYPSGFVFSERIPSEEELKAHYQSYDRHLDVPELTYERYRELLRSFEPYRKKNKLFDIGCGMGDFLKVAKEMGWEVYGCEYTKSAVEACSTKGINVFLGAPDQRWLESEGMDVVTSFEVIEHLSYPRDHIRFASHLLRAGGIFYCTTPNFDALERYLFKEDYNIIGYPEHLSYFTKKTLDDLLTSEGFQRQWLKTTGISPSRIRQSLGKVDKRPDDGASASIGSSDDHLRNTLEENRALRLLKGVVNAGLDLTRKGNSLKGLYLKA